MTTLENNPVLYASTQHGYAFRNVIELLTVNLRFGVFNCTAEGMELSMVTSNNEILFKVMFDQFDEYRITTEKRLLFSVNLLHLFKLLKTIQKKDAVQIRLSETDSSMLYFTIFRKGGHNDHQRSHIRIHINPVENITIPVPEGYQYQIQLSSFDFRRTIKDLECVTNHFIELDACRDRLQFRSIDQGLYERTEELAQKKITDCDTTIVFRAKYSIQYFKRVLKLCGLNETVRLSYTMHLPLRLDVDIPQLGHIAVCLRAVEEST